ncbi:TolC family protein [Puia sp. P3]|uniref:TolC family protein n=1 Tax=Puia sp. P3 TaxID=3423952 RepID=UPI003D67204E
MKKVLLFTIVLLTGTTQAADSTAQPGNTRTGITALISRTHTTDPARPPDSIRLSLWDARQLAVKHYPSFRQSALILQTMDYTLDNVSKARLPQLSVAGQATIQSDVTSFPMKLPVSGLTLPAYSKDQYKVYAQVDQLVYDGGSVRNQMEAARVEAQIREQALAVELHTVFDRVNQLYFSILLLQQQLTLNDLLRHNVQNGIDKLQAMLDNGLAYKAGIDELSAQLLQTGQSRSELRANLLACTSMLGLLTALDLNEQTILEVPPEPSLPAAISRPELLWYDYQKEISTCRTRSPTPNCAQDSTSSSRAVTAARASICSAMILLSTPLPVSA